MSRTLPCQLVSQAGTLTQYGHGMRRVIFDEEHDMFRDSVRAFVEKEIVPNHEKWEHDGKVDKGMFRKAGSLGFLGMAAPESYGGGGVEDFRYNSIINEEIQRAAVVGSGMCITLHNDVCLPYFLNYCNEEQADRWMPGLVNGDLMSAIAMTEPAMGSDLASMGTTAIRDGAGYVVNGSKTFITNGINSDLVITAVKTDPSEKHKGISLVVLEEGMEGFKRGRNLDKLGMKSQDTAELFFDDVFVPEENVLGGEGAGFLSLVNNLPQERLSIAITGTASAQAAFDWTVEYVTDREAFGQKISSFQNTRFELAEMKTELDMAWVFIDRQIEALNVGELTAEDAAEAKWWCTEMQLRTITRCLQLFGGYGFMNEYPIARAYADARVQTIYGGTTEIMKEIIGRQIVGR
jgi:alkylation response protein AidB-like acyl-CoA dehydrogenase